MRKIQIEDIAIIGAGGFGREISFMIDLINEKSKRYNKIGFYDDGISPGTIIRDLPVIGKVDELNLVNFPINVIVAVGNPKIQKDINQRLTNRLLQFPNIIHPDVNFEKGRNVIGYGNIITEGFLITCDIKIGNFNIFNTRISIGHDVKIGNYNVFNPNTQISGEVTIQDANFFGVNSCVLQGISIGGNNLIGACSLLTRNIRDGKKYFGVPATIMKE